MLKLAKNGTERMKVIRERRELLGVVNLELVLDVMQDPEEQR